MTLCSSVSAEFLAFGRPGAHFCPTIWRTIPAYDTGTHRFGDSRSTDSTESGPINGH